MVKLVRSFSVGYANIATEISVIVFLSSRYYQNTSTMETENILIFAQIILNPALSAALNS